jgi:hypothetical protein
MRSAERESTTGPMASNTRDSGLRTRCMVKAH